MSSTAFKIERAFKGVTRDGDSLVWKHDNNRPPATGRVDESNWEVQTGYLNFPDDRRFSFWYYPSEGVIHFDSERGGNKWKADPDMWKAEEKRKAQADAAGLVEARRQAAADRAKADAAAKVEAERQAAADKAQADAAALVEAEELEEAKEEAVEAVAKAVIKAKAVAKSEAKAKMVTLQEGNVATISGLETLKEKLEQDFKKKKEQEDKSFEDKEILLENEVSTKKIKKETLLKDIEKAEGGDKEKLEMDLKAMEIALAVADAKLEMVKEERKEAS